MKVLLTGVTGFIGSHVVRVLCREDCEVYGLVRQDSDLWRIDDVVDSLEVVRCDLLAAEELHAHLAAIRPELCIHAAWYAVPGRYLMAQENLDLLRASISLASQLASLGCRRFIGVGTCFEYDTDFGYLSETSATKPGSLYAASKLALQLVLEQLGRVTEMDTAWVRLFYQYGPFEDQRRLVPSVICSLLRDEEAKATRGEQIRDFLHVEDVAEAIWVVARGDLCGPVNIGSGEPVAVRDIVNRIGSIIDRADLIALGALPYGPADPMFICADNHLLKENTAWAPRYDLEQGLRHTVAWWQERLGLS